LKIGGHPFVREGDGAVRGSSEIDPARLHVHASRRDHATTRVDQDTWGPTPHNCGFPPLTQALGDLQRPKMERRLRGASRKRGERQRVRMIGAQPCGDVDDANQLAGGRLMDRRCGARPRVHRGDQMLGGEDLNWVIQRGCGPDGVGPRHRLRPRGPLLKAHLARPFARARLARHPQQVGLRVADRDNVMSVVVEAGKR